MVCLAGSQAKPEGSSDHNRQIAHSSKVEVLSVDNRANTQEEACLDLAMSNNLKLNRVVGFLVNLKISSSSSSNHSSNTQEAFLEV